MASPFTNTKVVTKTGNSSNQGSSDVLKISPESQLALLEFMKEASQVRDVGWQNRERFEAIDRAYQLEADRTAENKKAEMANRGNDPTKLRNMQVPMLMESVENTAGFLTNVYCTDYPMFKMAGDPNAEDIALQWNTLIGHDQLNFGWAGEFNKGFRNSAKYNFAPMECDWEERVLYKPTNGAGTKGVALQQVTMAGNAIRAIDPYNTIYDPRVPIHQVHVHGEFAGYIEKLTRIRTKKLIFNLGNDRLKNDQKALESPDWDVDYYIPQINPKATAKQNNQADQFNWTRWATGEAQNHIKYINMYTHMKLYARIMPAEFGIRSPNDQTPAIWKLHAINGVLVYAQPMVNAHDYLPIVIVQNIVDNLDHQTKSSAENQLPFQDMVNALWNAKMNAARRRTVDRMIYNPLLIDPDHINSPNPGAKIPIRATAYGRKLEEAVHVIPFNDENSQLWMQEANGVADWGMRANGQNRPSMGQFQKGNKLQSEWDQTMANAGNRERTQALMWEVYAMHPMKVMIKSNCLQFAPKGDIFNVQEKQTVSIDPVALRQVEASFEIGDGLLPIQKLIHADVAQGAMQVLATNPQVGAGIDVSNFYLYLLKVQGVDKLDQFKKTPDQMQYEQALSAWQNAAALLAKNATYGELKPEQMAQVLGPMPQPPQAKKPTQQNPGTPNGNTQPS